MNRAASVKRKTAETDMHLEIALDGTGANTIETGVGFFDHMLTLLARHALIDLKLHAKGDLHVDQHHTVEDVGICFGKALAEALGDKRGIARYGSISLPMEETLVTAAVDLSGRAWFVYDVVIPTAKIGEFDSQLVEVFWQAVAANALMNLHFVLHHGSNGHHIAEAVFKSAAVPCGKPSRRIRDRAECRRQREHSPSNDPTPFEVRSLWHSFLSSTAVDFDTPADRLGISVVLALSST